MKRWICMIVVALVSLGCATGGPDSGFTQLAVRGTDQTFTGSLSSSGVSWVTHDVDVASGQRLEATLAWASASANANLFLYSPSGEMLALANGTEANPEIVAYDVTEAGRYRLGLKCKTGSCVYTLAVHLEAEVVATSFSGTMAASPSSASWVTHPVDLFDGETASVELAWDDVSADFNVFLYDPDGALVVLANGTTARPETLEHVVTRSGTWRVGIKCKTGSGFYDLTVAVRSTEDDPPVPLPPTYPGRPAAGEFFWGAGVGGNSDPYPRHEQPAGVPLSVRRTFFQWSARTGSLVTTAQGDLAAGRLPWVSVKTPPWTEMADGDHDAAIDQMLTALDGLDGPVWLTIHHEPEGGGGVNAPDDPGGPSAHVAMNRRVRERMTALGTDNIALAPILMSYTWTAASGRDPEEWWAPGIYDFLGVDHYRDSENTLLDATWSNVRQWAAAHGTELAVGEWGTRGTDAAAGQRVHDWYESAIGSETDGAGARVVGLCAFDSGLNSPNGSWELRGEQLTAFQDLMADPRTASVAD